MGSQPLENKEVKWKVFDIDVHGTITAPTDLKPHPAVIFVAGSGPTDRNWCSPLLPGTNGSAKLLAEALASRGFVTLRYDKVASGPHVQENVPKLVGKISMQSHVEELRGAVETIITEKNVDRENLFVLTNSEGAIHAVNYQLQAKSSRFKGLVLTGAPGRTVGDVARSQIFNQIKHSPNAENLMKVYDDAIANFLADKPPPDAASIPEGNIRLVVLSLWTPANLPFSRELWSYSLPEHIEKVAEPILIVIGKKDIQVDWQMDGHELEKATAKKPDVSFVYPENANHVLKHEVKPREEITVQYAVSSYNLSDAKLDSEAADDIFNWLKKQV
jgi:alpha-beta hydrolase superfamily lysophospholipase